MNSLVLPLLQFIFGIKQGMSDSEEEGFHQPKETYFIKIVQLNNESRASKIKNHNINLFKSPTSIFYELPLFQYERAIDNFAIHHIQHQEIKIQKQQIQVDEDDQQDEDENVLLLSEYFPIKFNCIYNRFNENLMIKRDTTIIIRNIQRRIQNDQLSTFHQRQLKDKYNNSLLFSADFEGGNLHSVFKNKNNNNYYLLLQNDINTHGYNNWFYFNVKANSAGKYRFVIVNLSKKINFAQQLSLLVFSSKNNVYERSVKFQCIQSRFKHFQSQKIYWSIKFQYNFTLKQNVYFSLMPPYSYSKLSKLVKTISQPFHQYNMISIQAIYKTEIGNIIPAIKIANRQRHGKKAILITARQHPCQTVGSFICQEIIKIMISQQKLSKDLLQKFSFYIIPMVNPDGVIHGNSRTNMTGYDINRSWNMSSTNKTGQSENIWNYITSNIFNQTQIAWLLDLHGHSKILGFCSYFSQKNQDSLLMYHFLRSNSKYFDDKKSSFGINKDKINSFRGQTYKQLDIKQSITIQTSLYGFRNDQNKLIQYELVHFKQIAHCLLQSILQTEKIKRRPAKKLSILQQMKEEKCLQEQIQLKLLKQIQNKSTLTYKQIDSDSNPEEDYLLRQQRNYEQPVTKISIKRENGLELTKSQYRTRSKTSSSSNHQKYLFKSKSYYQEERLDRYKLKQPKKSSFSTLNHFYIQNKYHLNNNPKQQSHEKEYAVSLKSNIRQKRIQEGNNLSKTQMSADENGMMAMSNDHEQRQIVNKTLYLTQYNRQNRQEYKLKKSLNKQIKLSRVRVSGIKSILYPTSIANLGFELNKTNLLIKKEKIKQMRKHFLPYNIEKAMVQNRIKKKIQNLDT